MGSRLFVYGTLMTGERNHHLLAPFVVRVEGARVEGMALYVVREAYPYPAMVPGDGVVCGELVEVEQEAEALRLLDELEEYYGPDHPQNEYSRELIQARLADGTACQAWAYVWVRPTEGLRPIPGGDWRAR